MSKDMIRAFAGRMPVLGVCLGHQALVEVYGGSIVRAERLMHGKASQVLHDGRGLYAGLPNPFAAGRYHSLIAQARRRAGCVRSHRLDRGRRSHGRAAQVARARGRAVPPGEHPDARGAAAARGVPERTDLRWRRQCGESSLSRVDEGTVRWQLPDRHRSRADLRARSRTRGRLTARFVASGSQSSARGCLSMRTVGNARRFMTSNRRPSFRMRLHVEPVAGADAGRMPEAFARTFPARSRSRDVRQPRRRRVARRALPGGTGRDFSAPRRVRATASPRCSKRSGRPSVHAMDSRVGARPIWLSTAGHGVAWLHVRLDSRPKYYLHAPYREG